MAKNSPDEGKSTKMVEKQVDPSFNNLKEYRAKRQFSETPEPMADTVETPSRIPVFVVQKHEASHFHFDFRLEVDGVLKSWVVPKGPSMNPKDKRLAIQAEDHPLSYAHFEGVIPEGNYGAGTVEIWDSGTYAYVGNNRNISAAIKNGILEFKLHGHKLKGLFTLIHTLTTKDYFTNEEQLQLYSNQFYLNNFPGDGDIYKDNADVLIVSPLDDEVSGQRVIPETGGGWSWSALRSINFLLNNLGNCKDQKVRDKYEALARFFRAYFYFEKVKRFGDVPWYDKVLGSDDADLYKARDSREFVMGKIMEDLNFAIEVFKETNRTKELYRVTWWTAQALKSRVGLFEGTYRKYHGLGDYEKYLNDCVSASNEIMTASGGYSLYQSGSQSYRNLFKSENAIDAEIILARDYNNDLSLVHKVQAFENSPTLGRPGLSKKLVNYYLMKNGNRFTDQPNYATMEFKDEIVNRDPRLAQTIRTSNINMNVTMTGYHLLKYANDNMSYTGDSSNDLPLFRLAEVYLNYAEAKAELGTLTQTDIDNTVNKLRTRAGVTGKLNMNAANLSPDPYMCAPETGYVNITGDNKGVILEIRRERAIELVMEGFRYYDLMRWKEGQCMAQSFKGFYLPATAINKAYDIDGDGTNDVCFYTTSSQPNVGSVTYVKLASDGSGTSLSEGNYGNLLCYSWIDRTWNENRDYLYPIPRQEITLSNGVVTQNPGWNE